MTREIKERVEDAEIFLEVSYRPSPKHIILNYNKKYYSSIHGEITSAAYRVIKKDTDMVIQDINEEMKYGDVILDTRTTLHTEDDEIVIYGFSYVFTKSLEFKWKPLFLANISKDGTKIIWKEIDNSYMDVSRFEKGLFRYHKHTSFLVEEFHELLETELYSSDMFINLMSRLIIDVGNQKLRPLSKAEKRALCEKHLRKIEDNKLAMKIVEAVIWYANMNKDNSLENKVKMLNNNGLGDTVYSMFKYPNERFADIISQGNTIEEITGITNLEYLKKISKIKPYNSSADVVFGVKTLKQMNVAESQITKLLQREEDKWKEAEDMSLEKWAIDYYINNSFGTIVDAIRTAHNEGASMDTIIESVLYQY